MTIIYSGFDTIVFAARGALSPGAVERMGRVKLDAEKERRDVPYHVDGLDVPALLSPKGQRGGYAFVISTGPIGQRFTFKKNISRTEWNGHVKIRALALASHGWERAVSEALRKLEQLEFHVSDISLNRVDYCMDFLDTPMSFDPRDFVAHSRVKKTARTALLSREKTHVSTCKAYGNPDTAVTATMRSVEFESLTMGKMPGRQVMLYDKRREALDKRKLAWFTIWGIDRHDPTVSVRRIELRAGKNELDKYGIKTFEDFEDRIGDIFIKAAQSVRMIDAQSSDSNISRKPLHPTWQHVQNHVKTHLLHHVTGATPSQILEVIREEKGREYMKQICGNAAGYAVCEGISFQHISECLPDIICKELEMATHNSDTQFAKTYGRARDRLKFVTWKGQGS